MSRGAASSGDMDWHDARALAYEAAAPLPARVVSLSSALGATLASPLLACTALPPFDTSAMDGYAVAGAAPWRVVGRVSAGSAAVAPLATGTSLEVATGAVVPPGADSVLPYEQAVVVRGVVNGASVVGRHVRFTGEEAARGAVLAPAGSLVTPTLLGLAAAAGHDTLDVVGTPTTGVCVTGDELLLSGIPAGGRIRDAIGPMLPGLVDWLGGIVLPAAHVADSVDALTRAVSASRADVVLASGASSMGRRDHLREVLSGLGAELLVETVAVRPGHPQLLARLPDGRWVVGLPGNPLAALSAIVTLLQPLLARLAGRKPPSPQERVAAVPYPAAEIGSRLVPSTLSAAGVSPVPNTGPAMLTGVANADGFAVVRPRVDVRAGEVLQWLALPART